MSFKLKLPTKFVPVEINEANLSGFDSVELREIGDTYEKIKAEKFKRAFQTGAAVTSIYGSHGTGVRTLMKSLEMESEKTKPAKTNAERFITALPSFIDAIASGNVSREDATKHFLPAGKYAVDLFSEEALEAGYPIVIAKRGRTQGGVKLLQAFQDAKIPTHTIVYQAPLGVKLAAAHEHGDIAISDVDIKAEHVAMTSIMPLLASKTAGHLSIYFRDGEPNLQNGMQIMRPLAEGDSSSFRILDADLADKFNAEFASAGISVISLMQTADRAERDVTASRAKGFDLVMA